jgi:hypothetical protein
MTLKLHHFNQGKFTEGEEGSVQLPSSSFSVKEKINKSFNRK